MRLFIASALLAATAQAGTAATVPILQNPLVAAGFNPANGVREVTAAGAVSLPGFDVAADRFLIDLAAFGLAGPLRFVNALAADLSGAGANTIVLQDSDNDGNPATVFNAGTAANLIAGAPGVAGAGFFVYFNSALNINRLVFSTDLGSTTSDLAILAAITAPQGSDAIAALPTFGAANFAAVAPVPLPAALPLLAAALAGLGLMRRLRRG